MLLQKKTRKFLVSWSDIGLGTLYDLTTWEKKHLWYLLQEIPDTSNAPRLNMLILRARANRHQQHEIYIFETADLSETELSDAFESRHQYITHLIRENGSKIYSDYFTERL